MGVYWPLQAVWLHPATAGLTYEEEQLFVREASAGTCETEEEARKEAEKTERQTCSGQQRE